MYDWALLRHSITEARFCSAQTSIVVDGRYHIGLRIFGHHADPMSKPHVEPWFKIAVSVCRQDGTVLGVSPRNVSLRLISGRKWAAMFHRDLIESKFGSFCTDRLSVEDVEFSGTMEDDVLNVYFQFSY